MEDFISMDEILQLSRTAPDTMIFCINQELGESYTETAERLEQSIYESQGQIHKGWKFKKVTNYKNLNGYSKSHISENDEDNLKYYLCYVKENKAYFTSDWENQWGDDWDDAPYEHNAGTPYKENSNAESLGVWNGCEHYPKIPQKELYFEFPNECIKLPCDGHLNSPWSVDDINRGAIAWIIGDKFVIPAKTEYNDFIKIVKENNGKVYLEE